MLKVVGLVAVAVIIGLQAQFRIPEGRAYNRQKAMRGNLNALAGVFEAYKREHGHFPAPEPYAMSEELRSRLGAIPGTPFQVPASLQSPGSVDVFLPAKMLPFRYALTGNRCIIISAGPDEIWNLDPEIIGQDATPASETLIPFTYDPTNGTFSPGDIFVISKP